MSTVAPSLDVGRCVHPMVTDGPHGCGSGGRRDESFANWRPEAQIFSVENVKGRLQNAGNMFWIRSRHDGHI